GPGDRGGGRGRAAGSGRRRPDHTAGRFDRPGSQRGQAQGPNGRGGPGRRGQEARLGAARRRRPDRPRGGVPRTDRGPVRVAVPRPAVPEERGLVRGGPGLDQRDLPEPATGQRFGRGPGGGSYSHREDDPGAEAMTRSREYLLREGERHRLTEDHTLVHRMAMEGRITEAEEETHPQRSILIRALGVEEPVDVDEVPVDARPGDRVLLCSDGLHSMVSEGDILRTLAEASDAQQAADRLVDT